MRSPAILLAWSFALGSLGPAGCGDGEDDTHSDSDADTDSDVDTDTDADTGPTDEDGDGWTLAEGDCDDGNPDVNPEAEEVCDNGIDDNCDGSPAPCAWSGNVDLSLADTQFVGEYQSDAAGCGVAMGDVNGDGREDIAIGASYSSAGGPHSGVVYLVDRPHTGLVDLFDADATLLGDDLDAVGDAIAVGDVDGDGLGDILIGAWGSMAGGYASGGAYLLLGPALGTMHLERADTVLAGGESYDYAGSSVALGDLDGIGGDDLIIGAPFSHAGGVSAGAVYLVHDPVSGVMDLSYADAKLVGEEADDYTGTSVATGDVDGDGLDDVLVGAAGWSGHDDPTGSVYLVLEPISGTVDLSAAEARFIGKEAEGYVGESVAMGDVNGDGTVDILLGAALLGESKGPGEVLLFSHPVSGIVDLAAADGVLIGENEGDQAGISVTVGNVDSDEAGDILVGAVHSDAGGSSSGVAYLLFGPVSGTVQLSESDARFVGEEASDGAGNAVAFGDVDADGDDDLLIGAEHAAVGGENSGSAYLLLTRGL